jgi:hypothetical protein
VFDGLDTAVQPIYVAPLHLAAWLDRVRPHLARMADGSGGRYELTDIITAIAAGRMLLWVAVRGSDLLCALVTEIMNYPRLRAMRCIGISGHRARLWMPLLANVEAAAREHFGCTRFEALHQKGHERLLRTGGWRAYHTLAEKDL